MGTTCAKPLQCEFRENCLDQHNHQLPIAVSIAVSRVWLQRVRVVQGCENSSEVWTQFCWKGVTSGQRTMCVCVLGGSLLSVSEGHWTADH